MQKLRNWDNKTWLSSKKYILNFNKFLKSKVNLNKNSKILDIGCGRANIISALQNKYKFKIKPTGIDIIKNKNLKKNIVFKKTDGIRYFKKEKQKYDLILIKQTMLYWVSLDRYDGILFHFYWTSFTFSSSILSFLIFIIKDVLLATKFYMGMGPVSFFMWLFYLWLVSYLLPYLFAFNILPFLNLH